VRQFKKNAAFAAFEAIVGEAQQRTALRILAGC
jgi:hypothetical protein